MTIRGLSADWVVFDDLQTIPIMTAHVFYFKWPRIQEDLVHEEVAFKGPLWQLVAIPGPVKAFIYWEGGWFQKTAAQNVNRVDEARVPKEIRLAKLLLA